MPGESHRVLMCRKRPIIAVTGSSGAGTTSVQHAFAQIFRYLDIKAAFVHGDAFFRYNREEMAKVIDESIKMDKPVSHFGPEANLFTELEDLFREYSESGTGRVRHYIKSTAQAAQHKVPPGQFTDWSLLPSDNDLLFYEGLHGAVAASTWARRRSSAGHLPAHLVERRQGHPGIDVARYVDLLIGVVPVINLEWIQKIHRDCSSNQCSSNAVTSTILRRMKDYINFIVPQFSITDINFQRVPMVDTSNPFEPQDVPSADESVVVIHFRDPERHDFSALLRKIDGAFMSRTDTMVIPGGSTTHALEVICTPLIQSMMGRI